MTESSGRAPAYNAAVREAAKPFAKVMAIDFADALRDPADMQEGADHFHRAVYERQFRAIMTRRAAMA